MNYMYFRVSLVIILFLDLINALTSFQVCFEGIVGPGYLSDIAIDDVKLETTCLPRGKITFHLT